MKKIRPDRTLDAKGLCCPMPSVNARLTLEDMEVGEVLEILTDDPVSRRDLPKWAESSGNELIAVVEEDGEDDGFIRVYVKKLDYEF